MLPGPSATSISILHSAVNRSRRCLRHVTAKQALFKLWRFSSVETSLWLRKESATDNHGATDQMTMVLDTPNDLSG